MNQVVELDDVSRSVIAEGRFALEPSDLSRARVRRAVESKLAAGTGATPALRSMMSVKLAAAVLATAALAAGTLYKSRHRVSGGTQPPIQSASVAAPTASMVASSASLTSTASEPIAQPTASAPIRPTPTPVNVGRTEQLAEEIGLLAKANAAINGRDGGRAVQLLREFDHRFNSPVLAEERAAAGVLALCASGHEVQAMAAAKQFQARWPRSPMLPRIAASCAASK